MVKHHHVFAKTVLGVSHEKENRGCQDRSGCYEDDRLKIVVVADGHGEANSFRSDMGARFAVDCALEAIKDFVDRYRWDTDEPAREMAIGGLVRSVVASWQEKVERHYTDLPFTLKELEHCDEKGRKRFSEEKEQQKAYGTTLIAAALTPEYWFGFQIGDGRFSVLQADGSFAQPVPWDERCFLSVTTSICDMSAQDRPRVFCDAALPLAIFLCTDGIDDNYPVEENEQHLYRLYAQMALTFAEDGFDSAKKQIEQLCERFAREGKGDDTSLAVMVDMARIGAVASKLKEWLSRAETATTTQPEQTKPTQIEAQAQRREQQARTAAAEAKRKKEICASATNKPGRVIDTKARNMADTAGEPWRKPPLPKSGFVARSLKLLTRFLIIAMLAAGIFSAYTTFHANRAHRQTDWITPEKRSEGEGKANQRTDSAKTAMPIATDTKALLPHAEVENLSPQQEEK
jgi:serine/threonine protein phosphatase PrpC